ncbi:transmembrane protein, putative (macronuclear) [Tetrahymena thermophila SB210]|uniref:Transmembrane protein, putative n=1 Tax=Tetrahymena thermophila (strain SB210) TaxID=312017 RepID=Q22D14_TETTS|nr:transmembrane protein, putative [Tetrahymena thermophila SB210]EAR83175.1 transmembrane protein, putative [Tetrahymena thermophila SB210]|eukprot:XP_001030838.1 transmembrane protein, putative [Tetrahymena thermophila SB210]
MGETEVQQESQHNIQQETILNQQVENIANPETQQNEQQQTIQVKKPQITFNQMKSYQSVLSSGPQDTFDEIQKEDIEYLQKCKYNIALYPVFTLLGLFGFKKAIDFVQIPEIFRNPLLPPQAKIKRTKYMKYFMGKYALAGACFLATLAGCGLYQVNKFYMYLKYKNLVESYLDAKEREFLNELKVQGQRIDLQLKLSSSETQTEKSQ